MASNFEIRNEFATVHNGVDGDIPGDADYDRSTCSGLTGHGQCICRPDIGGDTDR